MPPLKRKTALLTALLATLVLAACGGPGDAGSSDAGSPGEKRSFPELEEAARGTTVDFFMYGGDDATNAYVDDWISPRLEERYGIELQRTPVSDTADVVNKLLNEKQAGRDEGSVDLIWINGENFYTGSQASLWFGPWAKDLPNARFIDWDSPLVKNDFGYPVNGYEAPWSQAQFVMVYDSAEVQDPPKSVEELASWAEENPGRFTYPAPPDFTGNAFVEQAFYQTTGQTGPYGKSFDGGVFEEQAPGFYDAMNGIEPDLWRGGETYPETSTRLDELYQNGEVDFTMSYNPFFAQRQVEKGIFPESTRTYLFDQGTLANTSYVAIPFNAPNSAGAQVVANFLESPEAQIELQKRKVVGGLTTLDPSTLPQEQRKRLADAASGGEATLPLDELRENRVPEARSKWLLEIQDGWTANVQRR